MKKLAYLLIVCCMLFSCEAPRYMYGPSAQNIPLLKKKNDAKLGINYSSSLIGDRTINGIAQDERVRGVDIHSAYAITEKFAIQFNYYNRNERQSPYGVFDAGDSGRISYKRNLSEIAFGYYKQLDDDKLDMLQVFIGLGKGKTTITDVGKNISGTAYARFLNTDVTRFYLQPALIINSDRDLVISISSRISFVKFSNTKTSYDSSQKISYGINDVYNKTFAFWEPAIIASYGFDALPGFRVESQFGISKLLGISDTRFRRSNFSIGATYNFSQLFKKAMVD